ncbi:MAG: peptide deformylase [Phycisphaerales bacterium]|nr:peptide deformylase [Phycisphaerales bacterium]
MSVDPAKLQIETYPTKALRTKGREIEVNQETRAVAARMVELMREAEGIGLAAPQVGLSWRLFVAHVPIHEDDPIDAQIPCSSEEYQIFLNPKIIQFSKDMEPYDEGCLSLPDLTGEIRRPTTVTMQAIDIDGNPVQLQATGLMARCWQHEIDHLDGIMILDRMSQMSRLKNRSLIREFKKAAKG